MSKFSKIQKRQTEFQRLVGFPIDSITAKDRDEMSEKYLFKAIEEIIELRREFPSVMNPWSRSQKNVENFEDIKMEFADVFLFLVNFLNVWKIDEDEILDAILKKQDMNFTHIKEKKMKILNSEMSKVPEKNIAVGSGNINAKYIFVGQNPGQGIPERYQAWSWHDPENETPPSTSLLRTILRKNGIDEECYFTNVVKVPTENNEEPTSDQRDFWSEFLMSEIGTIRLSNPDAKIIAMGNWADDAISEIGFDHMKITHPAAVLRGHISQEEYETQIVQACDV